MSSTGPGALDVAAPVPRDGLILSRVFGVDESQKCHLVRAIVAARRGCSRQRAHAGIARRVLPKVAAHFRRRDLRQANLAHDFDQAIRVALEELREIGTVHVGNLAACGQEPFDDNLVLHEGPDRIA